jgi:hypothetical protein
MKKCAYCGRENVDEAMTCPGCGEKEFKQIVPPRNQAVPPRKILGEEHLFLRLLVALGVWVVVSGISLHVAWQQGNHSFFWHRLRETQRALADMNQAIVAYQTEFKVAPTNFEQLAGMTNAVPEMWEWSQVGFTDSWKHPFIFSKEGTNCLIISYGRDGRPGGQGLDYDLTSHNPHAEEASPTFSQFFGCEEMRGMIDWSFICGGLAAILSFATVRIPNLDGRGVIRLGFRLLATLIGAIFVTLTITAVHFPSGH